MIFYTLMFFLFLYIFYYNFTRHWQAPYKRSASGLTFPQSHTNQSNLITTDESYKQSQSITRRAFAECTTHPVVSKQVDNHGTEGICWQEFLYVQSRRRRVIGRMSSRRRRSFVAAGDPFKGPPHMEEAEEEEEAWQDGPRGNNGTVEYYLNCTNI